MRRGTVLAAVAALALAGCGSHPARLSPPDRGGLLTRIANVQAAAAAGNKDLALQRLRGFVREVNRLRSAGELDAATAQALVAGALQAAKHAATEIVPPPPPAPTPAPPPKDNGKHKGEKKHGKHGPGGEGGD